MGKVADEFAFADNRSQCGLTKREYFAAQCMVEALRYHNEVEGDHFSLGDAARHSVKAADALLAALEEKVADE